MQFCFEFKTEILLNYWTMHLTQVFPTNLLLKKKCIYVSANVGVSIDSYLVLLTKLGKMPSVIYLLPKLWAATAIDHNG